MTQQKWSKLLNEKFSEFMKKAKFFYTGGEWGDYLMSEDTKDRLIELINWAREEAQIDACESCEKIDPKNAYRHVCENPPERCP